MCLLIQSRVSVSADDTPHPPGLPFPPTPHSLCNSSLPLELSDLLPINVYLFQSNDSTQVLLLLPRLLLLLPARNFANYLLLPWRLSFFCYFFLLLFLFLQWGWELQCLLFITSGEWGQSSSPHRRYGKGKKVKSHSCLSKFLALCCSHQYMYLFVELSMQER